MINANILADSVAETKSGPKRITTFELEYPRMIHSELMTHRVFSRNAASSRAIRLKTMIDLVRQNIALPVFWGKNQSGMVANEECNEPIVIDGRTLTKEEAWEEWAKMNCKYADAFSSYHKQIVNRPLEAFSNIKVVLTATEFDNYFMLRNHKDAQPEIRELAKMMYEKLEDNIPNVLEFLDWHLPYYKNGIWKAADKSKYKPDFDDVDEHGTTLKEACLISASCCAQVSYRKLDDSLEKAIDIYNKLINSFPPHSSPFEHQASPMPKNYDASDIFNIGGTHVDKYGRFWSGNFMGWIQYRQIMMNEMNFESMTGKMSSH